MAGNGYIAPDLFGYVPDRSDDKAQPTDSAAYDLAGRYAEFVVCANLTKLGYYVVHMDVVGFDLVLNYEGCSYRIDVKSTERFYEGPFKQRIIWHVEKHDRIAYRKRSHRLVTPADTDLLALFYRPLETTVFYPVLKPMREIRLSSSFVRNSGDGGSTLQAAIRKLQRRQEQNL